MSKFMISLNKIKANDPCKGGWDDIVKAKGYLDYDEEWPLVDAFKSNSVDDVIWALRCLPEHENLWRQFAAWCAWQVMHLMTDDRSTAAIVAAYRHSRGLIADEALAAARAAASDAAWDAAWDAARAAAWDAARAAARDAARDVARDAAWDAASDAARDAQKQKLIEILTSGECVMDDDFMALVDAYQQIR